MATLFRPSSLTQFWPTFLVGILSQGAAPPSLALTSAPVAAPFRPSDLSLPTVAPRRVPEGQIDVLFGNVLYSAASAPPFRPSDLSLPVLVRTRLPPDGPIESFFSNTLYAAAAAAPFRPSELSLPVLPRVRPPDGPERELFATVLYSAAAQAPFRPSNLEVPAPIRRAVVETSITVNGQAFYPILGTPFRPSDLSVPAFPARRLDGGLQPNRLLYNISLQLPFRQQLWPNPIFPRAPVWGYSISALQGVDFVPPVEDEGPIIAYPIGGATGTAGPLLGMTLTSGPIRGRAGTAGPLSGGTITASPVRGGSSTANPLGAEDEES